MTIRPGGTITGLLADWRRGSADAGERLVDGVYAEPAHYVAIGSAARAERPLEPVGTAQEITFRLAGPSPVENLCSLFVPPPTAAEPAEPVPGRGAGSCHGSDRLA